jgi:CBS domain-containing protein
VRSDQSVAAALDVLEAAAASAIPVLDRAGDEVAGWFTHQSVLAAVRGRDARAEASCRRCG